MMKTWAAFILALALGYATSGIVVAAPSSPAVVYQENMDRLIAFETGGGGLYYWFWDGAQWVQKQQLEAPQGLVLENDPVGVYQASMGRVVAFVIGTNGRLYDVYWSGTDWVWQDQANPGIALKGTPSAVYYQSMNQVLVFATGIDGHVYEKAWNIISDPWEDRSSSPSVSWAPYITGGLSAVYEPNPDQVSLFVIANDHRLYDLSWDGTNWRWESLGFPLPTIAVGTPSAIYRARLQRLYAFVIGANGMLYDVYWDGEGWTWESQGYPENGVLMNSPSAVYETRSDGISVFAAGVDGRVYMRAMKSSHPPDTSSHLPPGSGSSTSTDHSPISRPTYEDVWHWENLDFPASGARAEGAPSTAYQTRIARVTVFVHAIDKLYDGYRDASAWHWEDQGLAAGVFTIDDGVNAIPVRD